MDTLAFIRKALPLGPWAFSLDLRDAYFMFLYIQRLGSSCALLCSDEFSVQSASVRIEQCALDLHQGHGGGEGSCSSAGPFSLPVSGRLARGRTSAGPLSAGCSVPLPSVPDFGPRNQRGQIRTDSFPVVRLPGDSFRSGVGLVFPTEENLAKFVLWSSFFSPPTRSQLSLGSRSSDCWALRTRWCRSAGYIFGRFNITCCRGGVLSIHQRLWYQLLPT